jgi:hypothetical protein
MTRNDVLLERRECRGIAKEVRHPNEEVAKERLDFIGIALQALDILRQTRDPPNFDAPLDTPRKRILLVTGEIVAGLIAQQPIDGLITLGVTFQLLFGGRRGFNGGKTAREVGKAARHLLDRQREVHDATGDRRIGHAALHRSVAVAALRQRQASPFLDRLDPQRPVVAAPRQHDSDRRGAAIFGERGQEYVDRPRIPSDSLPQAQLPALHRQDSARWTDIDMVRLERDAVARRQHPHCGASADDLGEGALMAAREVHHQHKRHAGIGRHRPKQAFQGVHAAGGRAHSSNEKRFLRGHPRQFYPSAPLPQLAG